MTRLQVKERLTPPLRRVGGFTDLHEKTRNKVEYQIGVLAELDGDLEEPSTLRFFEDKLRSLNIQLNDEAIRFNWNEGKRTRIQEFVLEVMTRQLPNYVGILEKVAAAR